MSELPEIECIECGWQGDYSQLVCSDDDDKSNKPIDQIKFNHCPDCDKSDGIEQYED